MQRIYIYIYICNGCKPESGYAKNLYIYIYVTVANRNPVMQRMYIYIDI